MSQQKRRQTGFSLLEILTVITLTTFILASVSIAINSLHRVNRKLRDSLPADAQLTRLGLQFRTDVHTSQKMETIVGKETNVGILLTAAQDRTIEYRTEQDRITRIATRGGQTERREEFLLKSGSEIDWSLNSDASLATLSIRRHSGQIAGSNDDLQVTTITSAVNLDQLTR